MRDGVAEKFISFISRGDIEGRLNKMYLDSIGKVTTGIGYLIDSPEAAQELNWERDSDNSLASNAEIREVWNAIKSRQDLTQRGGVIFTKLPENTIHLSDAEIDRITRERLFAFEKSLIQQFKGWEAYPADAQFAILHMSWAKGPGFQGWPKFKAAANQLIPDFEGMADESTVGGLSEKRNEMIKQALRNAANVLKSGANPDIIYWPNAVVAAGIGITSLGLFGVGGYFLYRYLQGKGVL